MSVNWIHMDISAKKHVLGSICNGFADRGIPEGSYHIEDSSDDPVVLCDSHEVGKVLDVITDVSSAHPKDVVRIRYCASLPGSYHEILGECVAGNIEVTRDTVEHLM